jgi:hypothetical protein
MSSYLDKLAVYSDRCRAGQDFINLRLKYKELADISFPVKFSYPDTTDVVLSNWVTDLDATLDASVQEKRTYCTKGKAVVKFTGTTCIIRIGKYYGWGSADVYIDGVRPSTISNVVTPLDTVSSLATTDVSAGYGQNYPSSTPFHSTYEIDSITNHGYYDYVLADNLSPGEHTLELYVNNDDGAIFVFTCIKYTDNTVSDLAIDLPTPLYVNPYPRLFMGMNYPGAQQQYQQAMQLIRTFNSLKFNILNVSPTEILWNVSITLVNDPDYSSNNEVLVQPHTYPIVKSSGTNPYSQEALLEYDGIDLEVMTLPIHSNPSGKHTIHFQLSAEYPDPNGSNIRSLYGDVDLDPSAALSISNTSTTTTMILSSYATYTGSWFYDSRSGYSDSDPYSVRCSYTDNLSAKMTFSARGVLTVTVQKSHNWGHFNVYRNGVLFSNSSDLTCNATTDPTPYFEDIVIGDLGPNVCTVDIINVSGQRISFRNISYTYDVAFSTVVEDVLINTTLKYIPTYTPCEYSQILPYVTNGKIIMGNVDMRSKAADLNVPILNYYDMPIKTSIDIYARFPTYNICYAKDFEKELSDYDLVILDPYATSNSKVNTLHKAGCKVLLYTSFGEEAGVKTKLYDFADTAVEPCNTSNSGPAVGVLGPGGYANYYCKKNDNFAEISECAHDNSKSGTKTCSLNRSEYLSDTGRCSKACTKDSVNGYATYSTGGNCGGGYNSTDYWNRDAMAACSNSTCPGYTPNNSKCSAYEKGAGCGQDFSVINVNFPNQNGTWKSSYVNAGNIEWHNRILKYYLPLIFGPRQGPSMYKATLIPVDSGNGPNSGLGFRLPYINEGPSVDYPDGKHGYFPIDPDATMLVKYNDTTLQIHKDYDCDLKLGTFVVQSSITSVTPNITLKEGDQVTVYFTYFSPNVDGVFMDTLDSVDVYPSDHYKNGMINLIRKVRRSWPNKEICANRGFAILDKSVKYLNYVMAESLRSDYNWSTGEYYSITDPETVAYNQGLINKLKVLRQDHVFDVLSLNYAADDSSGDTIREVNTIADYQDGFLSATANILLNNVLPFKPISLANSHISTNLFRKVGEYEQ